jgi:hypothetical protein
MRVTLLSLLFVLAVGTGTVNAACRPPSDYLEQVRENLRHHFNPQLATKRDFECAAAAYTACIASRPPAACEGLLHVMNAKAPIAAAAAGAASRR